MGEVVGDVLPLAVGVAVSPIPVIAAILMLLSPRARSTGVAFLVGWVAGILVTVVVFGLLSSLIPAADADGPEPVRGVITLLLGAALLLLALRQWRARPKPGETAPTPTWMGAVDSMTPARGAGLGFLLSAVNPKNLLMAVGAGVAVGGAGLSAGEAAVAVLVFVVVASSTVAIPVIGFLAASDRLATPLEGLRVWLVQNNATVMGVLLLVIGIVMIGKGIARF